MTIEKALGKTINYAKAHKSYLNKEEISQRLISSKVFSKKHITLAIKEVGSRNDKEYPIKFKKGQIIGRQIENVFKNILFLGISGSVASGHPKKNDDIDFLVITKKNKLWETRLLLRIWIFIKRVPHRKYGNKGKKDDVCFNLWLDEINLLIPKNRRGLKTAIDLVLLKPLINKNMTYEKFILANDWAKKLVATPYENKTKDLRFMNKDLRIKQNIFNKFMNYLYFWPQYWYMKRKIIGEEIGLHQAFFHKPMVK